MRRGAPYGGISGRRAPFVAKPQRRAVSPLWGEVRPQKRFCPLQTCSPHSKPSQPPLGAWRAGWVHPHLFSVWQLGDALSFPRYSPSFRRRRPACVGSQSILPCSVREKTCRGFENVYEMHGCCTGPFEAPGHSCTELSGWLAHSGSLQGASESSQGYRSRPHPFSWPQDERQEECAPPISANCVSRSSFGFGSDAGPFGSCPDTSSYSMSGPLQARPSCLCRYLPQAVGPHGSSLPCVAPRAASHEAIPLVDEGAKVTPHCTSYLPYQGVARLLSTPFNVARPRLSPERGENGCDPPSPYDHDGRINDRLGRGLRRQTCERRVEGRVPLLAYKLPGTQGCFPGF